MDTNYFILTSFIYLAVLFFIFAISNILLDQFVYFFKSEIKKPNRIKYILISLSAILFIILINYSVKFYNLSEELFCEGTKLKSNGYFVIVKHLIEKDYHAFLDFIDGLSFLIFSFFIPIFFGFIATKRMIARLIIDFIGMMFLLAILMPGFVPAKDRAKISSVKANMHTLQTMLETYAVDNNGSYPKNIKELQIEATQKGYWKELYNPYNKNFKVILDLNTSIEKIEEELKCISFFDYYDIPAGVGLYNPIIDSKTNKAIKYYLYGTGLELKERIIIKDKRNLFYLSNM